MTRRRRRPAGSAPTGGLQTILGAIDPPGTRIPAEILRRRSAGVRDMRHGHVDEEWRATDPDDSISYYFLSATITNDPSHPLAQIVGDVLVRVPSASGPTKEIPALHIETESFGGIVHHQLQNHPDVYALLLRVLRDQLQLP